MNKQMFFNSIADTKQFDEEFFKRVYGYAVCDRIFIHQVAAELRRIGRSDVVSAYNEWYQEYLRQDRVEMLKVSKWYLEQCNRQYEKMVKDTKKVKDDWEKRKIQLLTRKKQLLNLLKSTDN